MKPSLPTVTEHQYLLPSGDWTPNPYEALNFKSAKRQIDSGTLLAYRDVEASPGGDSSQSVSPASPDTFEASESC